MSIRSARDVMQVARERGFRFEVDEGPPPMPRIVGYADRSTPALLDALKAWRLEIIEIVLEEREAVQHNGDS